MKTQALGVRQIEEGRVVAAEDVIRRLCQVGRGDGKRGRPLYFYIEQIHKLVPAFEDNLLTSSGSDAGSRY